MLKTRKFRPTAERVRRQSDHSAEWYVHKVNYERFLSPTGLML